MKASDICIGDWLNIYNFPNDNPKGEDLFPAKLNAIFIFEPFKEPDAADVELIFKNKEGGNAIASRPLDTCLPIELTEDILVKNGFHTYGESYFIPEDKCNAHVRIGFHKRETVVDLHRHGAFSVQISCKPGKLYIHQLQRLLNLCNIDKEIIL